MKYKLIGKEVPLNGKNYRDFILERRGITNIKEFLNPTKEHVLDPMLLCNIQEAAEKLMIHIKRKSKILVIVDSDVDGMTSAAILHQYVKHNLRYEMNWQVHKGKQHGIILDQIPDDIDLLILPDAGSNQYDEHKVLAGKGIDILILDHHEATKMSEYATIVNNQMCDYPNKALSGAGIVYKFCKVLDQILEVDNADKYLDLVAVGLVADMMDMRVLENRYLIKTGLAQISNHFLKTLVQKQAYPIGDTSNIIPMHISFYIAPLINALIRAGTYAEKQIMFYAFINGSNVVMSTKRGASRGEMETYSEQAARACANARNRQNRAKEKILESIETYIEENNIQENKVLFIPVPEGIMDKELSGLVAGQLASKYRRPVLLGHDKGDYIAGSGRGYDKSEMKEFKNFLSELGMFEYVEGHQNAFGFKIMSKDIDNFLSSSALALQDIDFNEEYYDVDFIMQSNMLDKKMLQDVAELYDVYGKGIEEPLIAIENIKIDKANITLMGTKQNTIKIEAQGQTYIMFQTNKDFYDSLQAKCPASITIIGRANKNEWAGNVTYQIIISNMEITQSNMIYY